MTHCKGLHTLQKKVHKTQKGNIFWLLVGCTSKLIYREAEVINETECFSSSKMDRQ